MDLNVIKELAPLGVGGVLAALMFAWHRTDMLRLLAESKGQGEILITLVKENTVAVTLLIKVVENLKDLERRKSTTQHFNPERRNNPS